MPTYTPSQDPKMDTNAITSLQRIGVVVDAARLGSAVDNDEAAQKIPVSTPDGSMGTDVAGAESKEVVVVDGATRERALPNHGVTLPSDEAGYEFWLNEFLRGKDHALLGMAHRARLGVGGVTSPRCEVAAAYYRSAAELALKAVENAQVPKMSRTRAPVMRGR